MQYINPFELYDLNLKKDINSSIIRRAKRKLLVELDLSEEQFINYKGLKISKDEILKLSDNFGEEFQHEEKIMFHKFIFETKQLSNFLSFGNIEFFEFFEAKEKYKQESFLNFIKPYYIDKFNDLSFNCFVKNEFIDLRYLVKNNIFENTINEKLCYEHISRRLDEMARFINKLEYNIQNKADLIDKDIYIQKLKALIKEKIKPDILNRLPGYFEEKRNNIALSLIDLSREIYRFFKDAKFSHFIICLVAKYLETSTEVGQKIRTLCKRN